MGSTAFCLAAAVSGAAYAKLGGASDSNVAFTAVGPAGLKIVGTTSELSVKDDAANVSVVVPLTNLTTGIALRDRHMKEKYLEVASFPEAQLTVARSALRFPSSGEIAADAEGTLRIHGQSHTVPFHYVARKVGDSIEVHGNAHVNMHDYGIQVPTYLGVTVKPDVDLAVTFKAKDA